MINLCVCSSFGKKCKSPKQRSFKHLISCPVPGIGDRAQSLSGRAVLSSLSQLAGGIYNANDDRVVVKIALWFSEQLPLYLNIFASSRMNGSKKH